MKILKQIFLTTKIKHHLAPHYRFMTTERVILFLGLLPISRQYTTTIL